MLYPGKPQLARNVGYQEQADGYRAGGPDCQPSEIKRLPERERTNRIISCQEAEEQHRLLANDLIQQRRAAQAADASAIIGYQQTGIAAWGLALGFITMCAAIAAAFYAKHAAEHTKSGADIAGEALRHARRQTVSQLRPYLSVEVAGLSISCPPADGIITFTFRVKVSNAGVTPAYNVCAGASIKEVRWPIVEEDVPRIHEVELKNFSLIAHGNPAVLTFEKPIYFNPAAHRDQAARVYFVMLLTYKAIIGEETYMVEHHGTLPNMALAFDVLRNTGSFGDSVQHEMLSGRCKAT